MDGDLWYCARNALKKDKRLIGTVINSERAGEGRGKPPAFSLFSLNKDNLYKYVCIRAFGLQISLLLTPS